MTELKRIPAEKYVDFGSFTIESGLVRISDPCYCPTPREGYGGPLKNGKGILIMPALNGKWHLVGKMLYDSMWGRRCAALEAFHESLLEFPRRGLKAGKLYVDSGQMAVVDDAHFPRDPAQYDYGTEESFYKQICNKTWSDDSSECLFGGCLPYGGVTSTGYGDGAYPAYTYLDDTGLLLSVTVEFIGNEEEEEDFDDDDDDDDDEWDDDDEEDEDDEDEEDEPEDD